MFYPDLAHRRRVLAHFRAHLIWFPDCVHPQHVVRRLEASRAWRAAPRRSHGARQRASGRVCGELKSPLPAVCRADLAPRSLRFCRHSTVTTWLPRCSEQFVPHLCLVTCFCAVVFNVNGGILALVTTTSRSWRCSIVETVNLTDHESAAASRRYPDIRLWIHSWWYSGRHRSTYILPRLYLWLRLKICEKIKWRLSELSQNFYTLVTRTYGQVYLYLLLSNGALIKRD